MWKCRVQNILLQVNMLPWNVMCVCVYGFSKWKLARFYSLQSLCRQHPVILSHFFYVSVSVFFYVVFSSHTHFMCVQFVIQTIGREMIWLTNRARVRKRRENKWRTENTNKKNLLRESRLTWKNSSRNIWIEICVNGCECECDVLNQLKLQLVQSLKIYSSGYVLFVLTIIHSAYHHSVSGILRLQ